MLAFAATALFARHAAHPLPGPEPSAGDRRSRRARPPSSNTSSRASTLEFDAWRGRERGRRTAREAPHAGRGGHARARGPDRDAAPADRRPRRGARRSTQAGADRGRDPRPAPHLGPLPQQARAALRRSLRGLPARGRRAGVPLLSARRAVRGAGREPPLRLFGDASARSRDRAAQRSTRPAERRPDPARGAAAAAGAADRTPVVPGRAPARRADHRARGRPRRRGRPRARAAVVETRLDARAARRRRGASAQRLAGAGARRLFADVFGTLALGPAFTGDADRLPGTPRRAGSPGSGRRDPDWRPTRRARCASC